MKYTYSLALVFALLLPLAAWSQISTKGKDFWFSYMQMVANGAIERQISLSAESAARVRVRFPGNTGALYDRTFNVVPGQTTLISDIPASAIPAGEGISTTGINITSDVDVSVFATYQSNARTESSSVLPVPALGSSSEYIVAAYSPEFNNNEARSQFAIVAVDDNTVVEVVPSVATVGGRAAGVPFQLTLNRGQVYQVQGANPLLGQPRPDLTGSVVRSMPGPSGCKPFAVFAGVTATAISALGCNGNSYQHLYEQQYPTTTWGRQYVLTPYANVLSVQNRGYLYRVLPSQDNTTITISNGGTPQTVVRNRGAFFEGRTGQADGITISRGLCITSDKPVAVAVYTLSQLCNGSAPQAGDPSLLMLTPVNQATQRVTVSPARMYGGSQLPNPQNERHFINVVMPTAATSQFRITGGTVLGPVVFQPVAACNTYSYAVIPIGTANTIPSYTLEAPGGFGAFIYGYNGPDAYAYTTAATFENQEINFRASENLICLGKEVTFSGFGTGVTSYEWNFGDGSPTVRGQEVKYTYRSPGLYTVRMRAATVSNCQFTEIVKEVEVLEVPKPNLGADTVLCEGAALTLSPNMAVGQFSFEWSTGETTPTIRITQPGTYSVKVTNKGQCPVTDEIRVSFIRQTVALGPDRELCAGQRVRIGTTPQAGVDYVWSPSTFLSNSRVANPDILPENNGSTPLRLSYVLTARDARTGCSASDTIVFTVRPSTGLATGRRTLRLCGGEQRAIGFAQAPATGYTYTWSPGTGLANAAAASTLLTAPNPTADSVQVQYVLRMSDNVCTYFDTTDVVIYRRPTVNLGPDRELCAGQTLRIGVTPQSNTEYVWSPATGLSNARIANPDITLQNLTILPRRVSYVLTARHLPSGCTSADTIEFLVKPSPFQRFPQGRKTVRACSGQRVQIGPAPVAGYFYNWSPADHLSAANVANPFFQANNTTADSLRLTYVLTISDTPPGAEPTGCVFRDTTDVVLYRVPLANAGPDATTCSGQPVRLGAAAVSGLSYTWSPAEGLSDASAANPTLTLANLTALPLVRSYVLRVVNRFGCAATDTVQVSISPALVSQNFANSVRVCSGDTVRLGNAPISGFRYRWSPVAGLSDASAANPVFRVASDTLTRLFTYVRTTEGGGCTTTDTVRVTALRRLAKLKIAPAAAQLCPGLQGAAYRLQNPTQGIAYRWTVQGGTLASGQGTAAVSVNWGAPNPAARLWVEVADASVCHSGGDTLQVALSVNLKPTKPFSPLHPDTLCANRAQGIAYQTLPIAGATINWGIAGGRIVAGQGSERITVDWNNTGANAPVFGKIWVNEQITTPTNVCFGTSDTLLVLLNPAPVATLIEGNRNACENSAGQVYSLAGLPASRYVWQVTGGALVSGQGTGRIVVNWGAAQPNTAGSPTAAQVSVKEITSAGCEGETLALPVNLYPLPRPRVAAADSIVCRGNTAPLSYRVAGYAGSRYVWQVTGGRIVAFNPDSSQVNIVWDSLTLPKRLTVNERSAQACSAAAALIFPVYYDATSVNIRSVSVQEADERNIEVRFRITGAPNLPQTFTLSRRLHNGNWQAVGNVQATDSLLLDRSLATDDNAYQYRLERSQQTGNCPTQTGPPHTSIVLQGNKGGAPNTLAFNWSAYLGWPRVARYELWRKLDSETAYRKVGEVAGNLLTFQTDNGGEAFQHCYRVKAIEAGTGAFAWSNEVCIGFDHPLAMPNVITPNNDGKNDRWEVSNLLLYPDNELAIYDRWGKLVYQTAAYRNDWDGQGLPAGTYFYRLLARRPNAPAQEFKGWIQVMRD